MLIQLFGSGGMYSKRHVQCVVWLAATGIPVVRSRRITLAAFWGDRSALLEGTKLCSLMLPAYGNYTHASLSIDQHM